MGANMKQNIALSLSLAASMLTGGIAVAQDGQVAPTTTAPTTTLAPAQEPAVDPPVVAPEESSDGLVVEQPVGLSAEPVPTALLSDEQALMEERTARDEFSDSVNPREDPDKSYFFIGAFYRHIFIPEFILDLFMDDSTPTYDPAGGVEFTYRKNGFDIITSLWFSQFKANGPFRAAGDPVTDVEIIDSNLNAIFASVAFMWSTEFNDIFAFEYGVDVGLGAVFGTFIRTEAYKNSRGKWAKCAWDTLANRGTPGADVTGSELYCDPTSVRDGEKGGQYGVHARKWSEGGSVPNILPWLALPHLALRIKPISQLMMRIEGGFGLGFFAGASVAYGF